MSESKANRQVTPDLYFSFDVESDGPIPGPFSLVSIGASCVGSFDGTAFTARDPERDTFYAELQPISDQWQPEALAVSGFTREHLVANGELPAVVMLRLREWVLGLSQGFKPVFAAYPLSFDWMFTHWYFVNYAGDTPEPSNNPFGFSTAIDMKTMYAVKSSSPIGRSTKRFMPRSLMSKRRHTHNALDDAIEQGDLFQNLMTWDGQR